MSAPTLDAPRSRRQLTKNNFELNAWLFMRISGVVLIILVLGHLLIMNILDGGVHRINFAFVAGRWVHRWSASDPAGAGAGCGPGRRDLSWGCGGRWR